MCGGGEGGWTEYQSNWIWTSICPSLLPKNNHSSRLGIIHLQISVVHADSMYMIMHSTYGCAYLHAYLLIIVMLPYQISSRFLCGTL